VLTVWNFERQSVVAVANALNAWMKLAMLVRCSPCSCAAAGSLVRSASACRAWLRCSRAAASSTPPELEDDCVVEVVVVGVPCVPLVVEGVCVVPVPCELLPCGELEDEPVVCACANPGTAPSATATTPAARYCAAGRMNRLLLS
jgi:hypothetical protein